MNFTELKCLKEHSKPLILFEWSWNGILTLFKTVLCLFLRYWPGIATIFGTVFRDVIEWTCWKCLKQRKFFKFWGFLRIFGDFQGLIRLKTCFSSQELSPWRSQNCFGCVKTHSQVRLGQKFQIRFISIKNCKKNLCLKKPVCDRFFLHTEFITAEKWPRAPTFTPMVATVK